MEFRPIAIKKTLQTSLGRVELNKQHCLCRSGGPFSSSPYLQETICFLGQEQTFERASETLNKLLGIDVWARQLGRISQHYGQQLEELLSEQIKSGEPAAEIEKQTTYYAQLDGGMVFTREQGWMEMKLARLFPAHANLSLHPSRNWIDPSIYVAHLGSHKGFLPKVERYTDEISELVFINDGASWIWKFIEANYPESTQILDFYHAKEHLCEFAREYFPTIKAGDKWIEIQTEALLDDRVECVIANIRSLLVVAGSKNEKLRNNLIDYYATHQQRMKYRTFRQKGLSIGSGPIEAAHRHVIQQRMKLSGQRWSISGAQQIANLRTAHKSRQWHKVLNIIRKAA